MSARKDTVKRLQEGAQDRHREIEAKRIGAMEAEITRQREVKTYGAVYVTIGKDDKPRFHSYWRGRLWPISHESAEKSFALGAVVYRKRAGVSIWVEAPEVFIG